MLETFSTISLQTAVLFILIAVGFLCSKKGFFSENSIGELSRFVLYVVTPCVIVDSFHRPYDSTMLRGLVISAGAAALVHLLNITLAHIFIREKDTSARSVMRYASVFSNCGYMSLPIQNIILGSDGVFYCATFIGVFTLFTWTYGLIIMGGKKDDIKLKKFLKNPGIIGIIIGLFIFLTSSKLPQILLVPIKSFTALNTPVPMLIIGYYLSRINSLSAFWNRKVLLVAFLRLIASPLISLLLLWVAGIKGALLVSLVISASAPSAANTVMFASLFRKNSELAVSIMSLTTLLSIITIPLIISFAFGFA